MLTLTLTPERLADARALLAWSAQLDDGPVTWEAFHAGLPSALPGVRIERTTEKEEEEDEGPIQVRR